MHFLSVALPVDEGPRATVSPRLLTRSRAFPASDEGVLIGSAGQRCIGGGVKAKYCRRHTRMHVCARRKSFLYQAAARPAQQSIDQRGIERLPGRSNLPQDTEWNYCSIIKSNFTPEKQPRRPMTFAKSCVVYCFNSFLPPEK